MKKIKYFSLFLFHPPLHVHHISYWIESWASTRTLLAPYYNIGRFVMYVGGNRSPRRKPTLLERVALSTTWGLCFDRESNPRPQRWPALMLISNIDLATAPLRQPILQCSVGFVLALETVPITPSRHPEMWVWPGQVWRHHRLHPHSWWLTAWQVCPVTDVLFLNLPPSII
jgi:hypothetical protein